MWRVFCCSIYSVLLCLPEHWSSASVGPLGRGSFSGCPPWAGRGRGRRWPGAWQWTPRPRWWCSGSGSGWCSPDSGQLKQRQLSLIYNLSIFLLCVCLMSHLRCLQSGTTDTEQCNNVTMEPGFQVQWMFVPLKNIILELIISTFYKS